MSFTRTVKDEISKLDINSTSAISELSAIIQSGNLYGDRIIELSQGEIINDLILNKD